MVQVDAGRMRKTVTVADSAEGSRPAGAGSGPQRREGGASGRASERRHRPQRRRRGPGQRAARQI